MTLLVSLLLATPFLFGIGLAALLRLFTEKVMLCAVGGVCGLVCITSLLYGLSVAGPITVPLLVIVVVLLSVGTLGLAIFTDSIRYWWSLPIDRVALLVLIVVVVVSGLVVPKLLFEHDGGLFTSVPNAWADLGWHVATIASFVSGQTVPPENPIFAGHALLYPFLINFLSSTLLLGGASWAEAVVMPALILIPLLFTLWYCLVRDLSRSRAAAALALLFFIAGGATLGWLRIGADFTASGQSLGYFLTHLPRDYTGSGSDPDGWHFLNPIISLLLPQRSFLFGLPVAFSIIALLVGKGTAARFAVAGILSGLLPLLHLHTAIALIPVVIILCAASPQVWWVLYFLVTAAVGLPELLLYGLSRGEATIPIRWDSGWTNSDDTFIWFWLKNTGLIIPATVVGFMTKPPRMVAWLAVGGLIIFAVANLFLFAVWPWDNIKLIIYWWLFSLPLVSLFAVKLWRKGTWLSRGLIVVVIALHSVSGSLDLLRLISPAIGVFAEWDRDAIAAAAMTKAHTQPRDVIATAPYHNTPVVLSGRPLYLGYSAHVWTHGGDPWAREAALTAFFEGLTDTLPDSKPQYVLVGPVERQRFPALKIRDSWQLVDSAGGYSLYKLPQ